MKFFLFSIYFFNKKTLLKGTHEIVNWSIRRIVFYLTALKKTLANPCSLILESLSRLVFLAVRQRSEPVASPGSQAGSPENKTFRTCYPCKSCQMSANPIAQATFLRSWTNLSMDKCPFRSNEILELIGLQKISPTPKSESTPSTAGLTTSHPANVPDDSTQAARNLIDPHLAP